MLTHAQIWQGIDRLAAQAETSPSGLARRAGLDPTTFNPSKRISPDGQKLRWPSTESLAKALSAAHVTFDDFARLASDRPARPAMPLARLSEPRTRTFDRSGLPRQGRWLEIDTPDFGSRPAWALQIDTRDYLPVYKPGTRLVMDLDSPPRMEDRVVIELENQDLLIGEMGLKSVQSLELLPLNPTQARRQIRLLDIRWIARIVWASQ